MDGLTDKERVEAWKSAWRVSLDGWAVVGKDFIFRSVNPQWLEVLEVLPSEFLGKSFIDITPPDIRAKDIENAMLTIEGRIGSYLIHKTFQFTDGTQKKIVLLVVRVPISSQKPFQFFLCRILLDEEELSEVVEKQLHSGLSHPSILQKVTDFIIRYWKHIAVFSAATTGMVMKILEACGVIF